MKPKGSSSRLQRSPTSRRSTCRDKQTGCHYGGQPQDKGIRGGNPRREVWGNRGTHLLAWGLVCPTTRAFRGGHAVGAEGSKGSVPCTRAAGAGDVGVQVLPSGDTPGPGWRNGVLLMLRPPWAPAEAHPPVHQLQGAPSPVQTPAQVGRALGSSHVAPGTLRPPRLSCPLGALPSRALKGTRGLSGRPIESRGGSRGGLSPPKAPLGSSPAKATALNPFHAGMPQAPRKAFSGLELGSEM